MMSDDDNDTDNERDDALAFDPLVDARLAQRMLSLRTRVEPVAFDAGFADRVMRRVAEGGTRAPVRTIRVATMTDSLQRMFARLAPLAAAATLLVGVMNVVGTRASGQPLLERVLGLPAVTVAAAYSSDSDLASWGEGSK